MDLPQWARDVNTAIEPFVGLAQAIGIPAAIVMTGRTVSKRQERRRAESVFQNLSSLESLKPNDVSSEIEQLRAAEFHNLYENNLRELAKRYTNIPLIIYVRIFSIIVGLVCACFAFSTVLGFVNMLFVEDKIIVFNFYNFIGMVAVSVVTFILGIICAILWDLPNEKAREFIAAFKSAETRGEVERTIDEAKKQSGNWRSFLWAVRHVFMSLMNILEKFIMKVSSILEKLNSFGNSS